MSPIDDELRAALQGRAHALSPSPDPLAGIERRAKRIQRTRIGTAVAGSALAVLAIAAVVPAIQTSTTSQRETPRVAQSDAPAPPLTSYALDPQAPWPYRGDDLALLGPGSLDTIQREYGVRHPEAVQRAPQITPLFGKVYEPSGLFELVFLADLDGQYRWGVVVPSEAGPEFLWDEPVADGQLALAAALPGDEVPRLRVVASPEAERVEYAPDRASEFTAMAQEAPGVGVVALEGDPATDVYRVVLPDEPYSTSAPDLPQEEPDGGAGTLSEQELAQYALDPSDPWPFRGIEEVRGDLAIADERLFYETQPSRRDTAWSNRPLYYGESDAGMSYLFVLHTAEGQEPVVTTTWQRGDRAPEQTEQGVEPGMKLVQALVPTDLDDGSVMLVALASPRAGGIVLEQPDRTRPDGVGDPGVGLWLLDKGKRDGEIVLYTEGDGLEYYRNPVDVGPDAYDD